MVHELRLKDSDVKVVEELRFHIQRLAATCLPPTEIPHSSQQWQAALEEFTVDFLLAAHVRSALWTSAFFPWSMTKGNYGLNWGNCDNCRGVLGSYFSRNLFLQSPFGLGPSGTGPSGITIGSFTDGTSNTHVASEILQGAPDDIRGTVWVDNPGRGFLHNAVHSQRLAGLRPAVPALGVHLTQLAALRQRGQPAGPPRLESRLQPAQPGLAVR